MKQKDQVDLEVAAAVKAVRSAIRLKYSIEADKEINEVVPRVETGLLAAAAAGKPYRLNLAALFEG